MPLMNRVFLSPLGKKLTQKYGYPYLTRQLGPEQIEFLNWAYEEQPSMSLPLEQSDEPNRFHIQLYHRTATQADLNGKQVLEVGCGHGGGASYLMRTLHPSSYVGLDLNEAAIAFCHQRHHVPGLEFLHGNAESLPFAANSFDAVINVESSHGYLRFTDFLSEVARVLRPGGHFLYTDFRPRADVADWDSVLANAPFRKLTERPINTEIMRGMEKITPRMIDVIVRRGPALFKGLSRDVAGVSGGRIYRALERGEMVYRMYDFVKD